jgi:hypothetical protein
MRHSITQTNRKDMEIEIEGMKREKVSKTKYLGTTVTMDNLIEEEIKKDLQPVIEPRTKDTPK